MLAYGRCGPSERERQLHEWWRRCWHGGFFPWISGRTHDDSDAQPHPVCVLEVRPKSPRQLLEQISTSFVDISFCDHGEHSANDDFDHGLMET